MEGTTKSPNSFDALSDNTLILKAIKMGVDIPNVDFTCIDIIRELEKTRNSDPVNEKVDQPQEGGLLC